MFYLYRDILNLIIDFKQFFTKKAVILFVGFAVIVAAVVFNVSISLSSSSLSDLALVNIEALAKNEGGGGKNCFDKITKAPCDFSLAIQVKDCSDCEDYWVTYCSDSSSC